MKEIIKSLIFSFFYLKMNFKNYVPIILYLLFTQFIIQYTQNIYLVVIFFLLYIFVSSPLVVNIFRSIILNKNLSNHYFDFFKKDYTNLYIKKVFYLLISAILIYILHILILSPFISQDISKITFFLYILFLYLIYIYTRLLFILPAASLNVSKGLKDSYLFTKGNSIKIYVLYLIIIMPYFFINILISNYAQNFSANYLLLLISIVIQVYFTILQSALFSYMYKDILEIKPKYYF